MKKSGLKSRSTGIGSIGGSLGNSIGNIGIGGSGSNSRRNNNHNQNAENDAFFTNGGGNSAGNAKNVGANGKHPFGGSIGGMNGVGGSGTKNGMNGESSQFIPNRGPQQQQQQQQHSQYSPSHGPGPGYSQQQQHRQYGNNGGPPHPQQQQHGQPPQTIGHAANNPHGPNNAGGNPGRRRGTNPNTTDEMALNQKNHRLAKELSDLRVRHREECKVVSRLTMENMNLASRCREAIAQVAALKKEVHMYQKRQSEWQLQIQQLQKEQQPSSSGGGGGSGGSGSNGGSGGKKHSRQLSANGDSNEKFIESKRSDSPTTDLDRIMSQQFSNKMSDATMKGNAENNSEKNDAQNAPTVTKKFQELSLSTNASNAMGASNVSSGNINTGKLASKRTVQSSSKTSSGTDGSNLASANTKIPISINPTQSTAAQKDDEFDADIDMVDFFAKSQAAINSSPGTDAATSNSNASRTHIRKNNNKGTDDHMPEDVVSPPGGFSPGGNQRKQSGGSNLLSSIDAFEASFASAFPDTSFTITSESPSSASLNMAFDVPDFGDPFFNSSGSIGNNSSSNHIATNSSNKSSGIKSQIQNLFPESAMSFKTSPIQNPVFDSPMNFSSVGMPGSSSSTDTSSKGRGLVAPEKLDTAFSRTHGPTISSSAKEDGKGHQKTRHFHNRSAPTPLSPQSMSAEIQQLDAIANLTSTDKSESSSVSGATRTRKLRNVKQPVSYAEPSLNAKLRRGDVLFPKVDPEKKYQQSGATVGNGNDMNEGDASNAMNGKNPEEVLKDLELSTPAMVDMTKE